MLDQLTNLQQQLRFGKYLLAVSLLIVASAVFLWTNTPYDIDDALITYRYADNIATGIGFVYNPGEHILGTSTPLYTLILATLRLLGIPVPLASNVLNFLASIAIVAVTMVLVQQLSGSSITGMLAVSILLVQGSFLRYSMAGMETPLYTLLIVATFFAFINQHTWLSATLAALAALTRLDGLGIVGAVLLACWIQRRRLPLKEMLTVALILAPWVVFAFLYFGSPIPLAMLAKQQHLRASGGSKFWIWDWLFLRPLKAELYLPLFMLCGVVWLLCKRSNFSRWMAIMAWLIAYLVAYTAVAIDFYEWYLVPVYPVLAGFAALGLHGIWTLVSKHWPPVVQVLGSVVGLALVLNPYLWNAYESVRGYKQYLVCVEGTRVLAGAWLRDHTPTNTRVAAGAIGHIGYESKRYIIDTAGLVTPPRILYSSSPDYGVEALWDRASCGPLKQWGTGWPASPQSIAILRCSNVYGTFGNSLVLAEVRLTDWFLAKDGTWQQADHPYLETQWLLQGPRPDRDWTLYMHFMRLDGTLLAQGAHLLGLGADGSILPSSQWEANRRFYDYVPLPKEVRDAKDLEVRLGLWDPVSGEKCAVVAIHAKLDQYGLMIITLPDLKL